MYLPGERKTQVRAYDTKTKGPCLHVRTAVLIIAEVVDVATCQNHAAHEDRTTDQNMRNSHQPAPLLSRFAWAFRSISVLLGTTRSFFRHSCTSNVAALLERAGLCSYQPRVMPHRGCESNAVAACTLARATVLCETSYMAGTKCHRVTMPPRR